MLQTIHNMPHIHEAIDFTITAFVVHQDRVLLINHKQLQMWLPLGGHVELDEDSDQALFREILEESGMTRDELEVYGDKPEITTEGTKSLFAPTFLNIHQISDTHRHIGMVYLLRSKTDKVALAEEEHNGIRWFTEEELGDQEYNLNPAVKFYATEALRRLGS